MDKLGNENRHLLEMSKDLKGEIDVERVLRQENDRRRVSLESNTRVSPEATTRPEVEQLCEELGWGACSYDGDETVLSVLDAIANILATDKADKVAMMVEECGGLDKIEQLQSHSNELIYLKALNIIEKFFPDGDQIDEEIDRRTSGKAIVSMENGTKKGAAGYHGGKKDMKPKKSTTNLGRGQQNSRRRN